jgi:hypothetical protein
LFLVLGRELPPDYTFPNNEAFDPKANTWQRLAPMPEGRHGTMAATLGDHVYLAGGSLKPGGRGVTDEMIVFHTALRKSPAREPRAFAIGWPF